MLRILEEALTFDDVLLVPNLLLTKSTKSSPVSA